MDQTATRCLNCDAALTGPFCAHCGQRSRPPNPTIRDIAQEFVHELLSVDGKIVRSVRLLLTRPGFLTREALAGRRASYESPIRLYLTFSVLFFAALVVAPDLLNWRISYAPSPGEVELTPERIEALRQTALVAVDDTVNRWLPRLMFLLVPLFAAFVMLSTRSSRRNYPQHLFFSLHLHAAWFFAGVVTAGAALADLPYVSPAARVAALVWAALYFVLALRRAYGLTVAGALVRAAVVAAAYLLVIFALLLLMAIDTAQRVFAQS